MPNRNQTQVFALSFLSVCFCLGISLGVTIKFGKIQQSDAAATEIPLFSPDFPSGVSEEQQTITIKAVGDIIPGTNFPNYRLPSDSYARRRHRNQLLPQSVRTQLQGPDDL
ncbi:hypothetical protein [Anabaena lutea]|uniref:hypothetical protein n=1 Tax=Anabaena lutea TaxID=212350 RepID=UPI001F54F239|nr:hypothetical protein [Anabaena lutea]